jgi:hypothetical protein
MEGGSMRSGTLCLVSALACWPYSHAQGQRTSDRASGYVLEGRVMDTSGATLSQARIGVLVADSLAWLTSADSTGAFRLEGLSSGVASILVRRLGYRARVFKVVVDATTTNWLNAVLIAVPRQLERVRVNATVDESKGALREFYEHRERAQFGYFLDLDEITKRRPLFPSDLLRTLPGVRLLRSAGLGSQVRVRGCRPLLWINGQRVLDGEFDDTVSSEDIAALEVYTSFAGIPAQYVDRETHCGAIVVWTRS